MDGVTAPNLNESLLHVSLLNDITLKRFWSKVTIQDNSCWNYEGFHSESGYPQIWFEGKSWRANRFALWMFCGQPPEGKSLALHTCNNKACVNPKHLYWGDELDNRNDLRRDNPLSASFASEFKPGHVKAWNGCRNLLDSHVGYIKRLLEAGYGVKEIARWYDVSPTPIERIKAGKTYSHVPAATIVLSGCAVRKPDPSFGRQSLTSHDVREIRQRFAAGADKNDLAREFGVGQPSIHKVVTGQRWKEVA